MNKATLLILSVIALIVIFVLGGVFGMFLQAKNDALQIDKSQEALRALTSNAVASVVVYGKISNINGRTITVSFNGDTAVVKLSDNAAISSFEGYRQGDNTPQNINLSQVQEGQTVSISSKILVDGSLQGESLMVLSATK